MNRSGILDHRKSKSSLPLVIAFRHSTFNFLFKNKGKKSDDSSGSILLEIEDFERCRFPDQWHMVVHSIADGVQIYFPVKVRLFLSWSPKTHTVTGEAIVPHPWYRREKMSIYFGNQHVACPEPK